jgi:hypothetical protein
MGETVKERRKSDPYIDRRSAEARRQCYYMDYFIEGGVERRERYDRRQQGERRSGFVQVSDWSSVYAGEAVEMLM